MKTINLSGKAKKLYRELLKKNRSGRTWRDIAEKDYGNKISFATLNKIVLRKGTWVPQSEEDQILLGLKKPKRTGPLLPKWLRPEAAAWFIGQREKIKGMSKQTREDLKRRGKGE